MIESHVIIKKHKFILFCFYYRFYGYLFT